MRTPRLSALDASFLDVETPDAHMHVGWAATFTPAHERPRDFASLRDHIAARLGRAPRYRQKLADVPLGVNEPEWIDDPDFDPDRHIRRAAGGDLGRIVDDVMSVPLERDRPLWEIWLAPNLDDGSIGLVGKAHHCMVDGLAAVELASLLLDASPAPPAGADDGRDWSPEEPPGALERFAGGTADRLRDELGAVVGWTLQLASPQRIVRLPVDVVRASSALARTVLPIAPPSVLNQDSSPLRHLAAARRPLDELRDVKRHFGTTVNDVVLAAAAGAVRRYVIEQGAVPTPLKTMVPVSVRSDDERDAFGNRISFMFVELPCDEHDPVRRLELVHEATAESKEMGAPEQSSAVLKAASHLPRPLQRLMSKAVSSPLMFNLVVSNIPGPREPLWLNGHRLEEAYPIVPLADQHALSIGVTTVGDDACFGLYADRTALPDADRLAEHLDAELGELLERAGQARAPVLV
jgi:diacylglycerol O-acyltransferase